MFAESDDGEGFRVLELEGRCTVERVKEIRTVVADVMERADRVKLSLLRVEEIDVSFLQLLQSAAKTAKYLKKHLVVTNMPEPVRKTAQEAGFASILAALDDRLAP